MTAETGTAFVPTDSLANRLALIRRELGLSQREAAIRCGVGFGSWQSWEKGSSPRNALRDLIRVAEELRVDRDWLMFGGPLRPEQDDREPVNAPLRAVGDIPARISHDHEAPLTQAEILRMRKRIPLRPAPVEPRMRLVAA